MQTPVDTLSSIVELSFSCKSLPKLDTLSKSDPLIVVQEKIGEVWKDIGRTEQIQNDSNPQFTKTIEMKFFFEQLQNLQFIVLDSDDPHKPVADSDLIGTVTCCLGEIVGSVGNTLTKTIQNPKHPNRNNGQLTVRATEIRKDLSNEQVTIHFSATNLDNKDTFSKSDPFLVIYSGDGNAWTPVHKTEWIKDDLNPVWQPFTLPVYKIAGNEYKGMVQIECYDYDDDGGHDLIGKCIVPYQQLFTKNTYDLIHPKLQEKKGPKYVNSGVLTVRSIKQFKKPSFLDYITGGTEVSLVIGVDYTGSNGNPSSPDSLHFLKHDGTLNEYEAAIRVVGDIISYYDNDKLFPAFGFGAHLNGTSSANHCFNINLTNDPNCPGIDAVLQNYRNSFNRLALSGPTNFAPIINRVGDMASQFKNGEKYFILLMITDGAITDMGATVAALRRCANLPMSLVIVGVGGAKFDNMGALDDDEGSMKMKRDIVQFVPFRKYASLPLSELARDTLAEIPKQVVDYMTSNGIQPRPFQPIPPPTY